MAYTFRSAVRLMNVEVLHADRRPKMGGAGLPVRRMPSNPFAQPRLKFGGGGSRTLDVSQKKKKQTIGLHVDSTLSFVRRAARQI